MRYLIYALIFLANTCIGATLLQCVKVYGILPNITVLAVVSLSFLRGRGDGAIAGAMGGVFYDIFFGSSFGYHGILLMLTGFVCGAFHESLNRESFFMPIILGGVASLFYNVLIYVSGYLFAGDLGFVYYMSRLMLPEAGYSALLALPVYLVIYAINGRIERTEKYRRKVHWGL